MPSPSLTPWSVRMADSILRQYSLSEARWHYEHGLLVQAVWALGAARREPRYLDFARSWLDHFITPQGDIRTYRLEEYNLDQVNPGKLLFPLYERSGEERYRRALLKLRRQLAGQPRTPGGGFWHKQIYPDQMWLDGIYMAGPFYAEFARRFDEPAAFADVIHQVLLIERQTRDPRSGLLYHACDEARRQPWADPFSGCSPHFWGRALGWYAMALVDILPHLPPNQAGYADVLAVLQRLARALAAVQDAETGLWYQVIDRAGQPGNYRESSVSAMLVYAFARAVRLGLLEPCYLHNARRAFQGLLDHQLSIDGDGWLTLENICGAAGLGGVPYRDGSYAYYIGEKIVPNDFKGVGPFILAALELETLPGADAAV